MTGLLLGMSGFVARVLRPIVVAFYSVPLVALAPLFIMFFGLDMLPKIVLVTIVVFFLLFFNTMRAGLIDRDYLDVLRIDGIARREDFGRSWRRAAWHGSSAASRWRCPMRWSPPRGEMLAARRGLGFLLSELRPQFDMTSLYAALFILMCSACCVSEPARLETCCCAGEHPE